MTDDRGTRGMHETVEWAIRRTGIQLPDPVFRGGPLLVDPDAVAEETPAPQRHAAATAGALVVLATLALLYTLHLARAVLLPIVVAILLSFLLRGAVRWLKRHRVTEPLGAAIVVFGSTLLVVGALALLSGPAAAWVDRAPGAIGQVERKLRTVIAPIVRWKPRRRVWGRWPAARTRRRCAAAPRSGFMLQLFGEAADLIVASISVIFLTYFLLASGDLFMRKTMKALPWRAGSSGVPQKISDEVEAAVSAYLRVSMFINIGLGLATWGILARLGMPNAGLWGTLAGLLNVVPYLGAIATTGILAVAALTVFDNLGYALLVPGAYFLLNMVESNIATPLLLGRQFP
ncbi:MAG: AI-2E family transporter [Gemmatimonadetes bacterium]|nr:AI-2E family transporter [Gemmatimonadota bacterium]